MAAKKDLSAEIKNLKKKLKAVNEHIKSEEYGIRWIDVAEPFEEESKKRLPVLREIKEKSIQNNDGKPTHILIEGDNLHALACLNRTHHEKIDLIYIDPPYNTGSKGFRYKDKRLLKKFPDGTKVPKDNPLKYSGWLSFMSKRLESAHNLLRPDGVIFISINYEQYAYLKLLCDKIFGEANYLTTFTVKARHENRILKGDRDFHETTEQVLMYRKSEAFKTIKRLQDNSSVSKYVYRIKELSENPEIINLGNKQVEVFRPHEYKILKTYPSKDNLQKVNIRGSLKEGNSSGRFQMKYLEPRNHLFDYLYKVSGMGDDGFGFRYFLTRASEKHSNGFYFQGVPKNKEDTKEVPYPNFLDFEDEFTNVGNEGGVEFRNGKKPVDFIKYLINMGCLKKDAVILDFFAGSGSTAQAVIELNHLDKGTRKVILCTNNEAEIATGITYPRFRNIIQGHQQLKIHKETLFELELNPDHLTDNSLILNAISEFGSEEFRNRYNEIKQEVRKNKFVITGIVQKEKTIPGLGNSLKYYVTAFTSKN